MRTFRRYLVALVGAIALCNVAVGQTVGVPDAALRYRAQLTREAETAFGPDAPVAAMAAQVHQESGWDPQARSLVGAVGMAQFMPETSAWIAKVNPRLAAEAPLDPTWAIVALTTYDKHLWDRTSAKTRCDHMAKTLSAYNGGLGWIQRDEARAKQQGIDAGYWFAHMEVVNAGRRPAAWRENRGYPQRILKVLEPVYARAGWGPGICST